MAVKTLDNHIKKAFTDLGFTEEEIKNGCWLLERENKKTGEMQKIAWIALHKFLEKVANKAGINFNLPTVLNCETGEIAVCVEGIDKEGNKAWSIGEASPKNCKNDYRWAMAEKRAKDRVILKLLGIAGDMYSEDEADEFKEKKQEKTDFEKDASKEKAANTKAMNKALATGTEYKPCEPNMSLKERYDQAKIFFAQYTPETFKAVKASSIDKTNRLVTDLRAKGYIGWAEEIQSKFNELSGIENFDFNFNNQELKDYRV